MDHMDVMEIKFISEALLTPVILFIGWLIVKKLEVLGKKK